MIRQLRSLVSIGHTFPLSMPGLRALGPALLAQHEYEEPIIRAGTHLMHSHYFRELVALACELKIDLSVCSGSDAARWAWFRRYSLALRTAEALIHRLEFIYKLNSRRGYYIFNSFRTPLPQAFCVDVGKRVAEAGTGGCPSPPLDGELSFASWEDHAVFTRQHDEQLLQWLNKYVFVLKHNFPIGF